jgi:hypothetical protein
MTLVDELGLATERDRRTMTGDRWSQEPSAGWAPERVETPMLWLAGEEDPLFQISRHPKPCFQKRDDGTLSRLTRTSANQAPMFVEPGWVQSGAAISQPPSHRAHSLQRRRR